MINIGEIDKASGLLDQKIKCSRINLSLFDLKLQLAIMNIKNNKDSTNDIINDLMLFIDNYQIEKIENNENIIIYFIKFIIDNINSLDKKVMVPYCFARLDKINLVNISYKTFVIVFFCKSLLYFINRDYINVIKTCSELINNGDKAYANYFNRGSASFFLKDYKKAINDYKQVIKLNPSYTEAFYNLGLVYYNINNKNMKYLIKAFEMNKSHTGYFTTLAQAYIDNNRYNEIDNLVLEYLRNAGGCPIGFYNIANIYFSINNLDKALKYVNIIIINKDKYVKDAYLNSLILRSKIFKKQNKIDLYDADTAEIEKIEENKMNQPLQEVGSE